MGYLENLMHSSKNLFHNNLYRMKVKRSETNSGSFETYLFRMMKLIVDFIKEEM